MLLIFSDDSTIELDIHHNELGIVYQKIYKNLSRIPIPFLKWDNPYYCNSFSYIQLVDQLAFYAKQLSIDINKELCLQKNQKYINQIHKIFEDNYNGDSRWLDFHEHIHLCENYGQDCKFLQIDYRAKAGPLEKPFDMTWFTNATTKIKKGDIYTQWSELGKTPYVYWKNNEPSEISRLCELALPWHKLVPKIMIAVDDIDTIEQARIDQSSMDQFNSWWSQHSVPWCQHWGLNNWTLEDMYSVLIIGKIQDTDRLIQNLQNNIVPSKILP